MESFLEKKHNKEAFDRADEQKQNHILEIGVAEFAEKGYESANINVIAQKAGISIGLMYKYFATKEDLFLTCVTHGIGILEGVLNEIRESDEKLLKKTELLIRAIQQHSRVHKNYVKLYNEMTGENRPHGLDTLVTEMESISARIYSSMIEQARNQGDIRSDCDPKLFAFFLDNLLMMLQFSYSCEYYRQRFIIYAGIDVFNDDEKVVTLLLKFIESAFTFSK